MRSNRWMICDIVRLSYERDTIHDLLHLYLVCFLFLLAIGTDELCFILTCNYVYMNCVVYDRALYVKQPLADESSQLDMLWYISQKQEQIKLKLYKIISELLWEFFWLYLSPAVPSLQWPLRHLTTRFHVTLKPQYIDAGLSDSSQIWQVLLEPCCQGTCQISEWCHPF